MIVDSFLKKLTPISILLVMTIFFSACGSKEDGITDEPTSQTITEQQNELETYKEFFSSSKTLSILATDLWKTDPTLHEESDLSLYNEAYQSYLIVLTDEKSSFPDDMNIDLYSELTAAAATEELQEASVTESESVKVEGLEGRKFFVEGIIDGTSVTYLFLILENSEKYVQSVLWSFTENIENNEAYYDDLIGSVKIHEVESED
ncbi:MAG TPA: hypothetical protein VLM88_11060 [Proteiniclasticum sp.]|nr:hypothetical protein [Proteiniclasticum sp.]